MRVLFRVTGSLLSGLVMIMVAFIGCGEEKGPAAPRLGTIIIDQTPDDLAGAGWQVTGPSNASGSGDSILASMPAGAYSITWNEVSGYSKPTDQSKVLAEGDTVRFVGVYSTQLGTILVDQEPDDLAGAGWTLTGPVTAGGSGDTTLTGMPAGEYTITWNEVTGYIKPSSQAKTLVANDTIMFIGSYQLIGRGWLKIYGGPGDDVGNCVQQTSDGGFIVVGQTESYGAGLGDVWLLKVDANGDQVWDATFGGSGWDWGESVIETSDGYVIVGATESVDAGYDIWLIKTDQGGNMLWEKRFGEAYSEVGYCVRATSDGGYIIVGRADPGGQQLYDIWLIKTDQNGNQVWNRTFGGDGSDLPACVGETSDGGYIIVGETQSLGKGLTDAWLIRTDSDGQLVWDATFGGTNHDYGRSVYETSDGSFIIAGFTRSLGAGWLDAWLLKVDASGHLLWEKAFGGSKADWAECVMQTLDGGYIIAGYTASFAESEGGPDAWLIRTDGSGNELWTRTFGGTACDRAYCLDLTIDGGYIIVGCTNSYGPGDFDVLLIKTDADGNLE